MRIRNITKTLPAVMLCTAMLCTAVAAKYYPVYNENGVISICAENKDMELYENSFLYKHNCETLSGTVNYHSTPSICDGIVKIYADAKKDSDFAFLKADIADSKRFMVSYKIKAMQTNQMLTAGLNGWMAKNEPEEPAVSGIYFGQNGKIGYAPSAVFHSGNQESEIDYTADTWYSFDTVYDLNKRSVEYYINGEFFGETKLHERVLNNGVASIVFQIRNDKGPKDGSGVFLIDDVTICSLDNNTFTAYYTVVEKCITVNFSQSADVSAAVTPVIANENGTKAEIEEAEFINTKTLKIHLKDELKKSDKYTLFLNGVTGISGDVLLNDEVVFNSQRSTIQIFPKGKSYADFEKATDKMSVISYHSQTQSGFTGEREFKFNLPAEGEYTAYISDENSDAPYLMNIYNREEASVFKSDFENYTGVGKPSDWSRIYGSPDCYKSISDENGNMIKLNSGDGELRIIKQLSGFSSEKLGHISFEVISNSSADFNFRLLKKYVTGFTGENEQYVFDAVTFGKDGFIKSSINQKADSGMSENDMKYDRGRKYRADIWIDWDMKRITCMIDGEVMGRNVLNSSLDCVEGIAFQSLGGNSGDNVIIDNVNVENVPYEYAAFLYECGKNISEELSKNAGVSIETEKTGNIFPNECPKFFVNAFLRKNQGEYTLRTRIWENGEILWENTEKKVLFSGDNEIVVNPSFKKYGVFEFTAEFIEDNYAERIPFSVVNAPVNVEKNSDFGINDHISPEYGDSEKMAELSIMAGFGNVRSTLHWENYQKADGSFEIPEWFLRYDALIEENGIAQIMPLGWDCPQLGIVGAPDTESELKAYALYAENLARALKGKKKYYEIWNEFSLSSDKNVEAYLNMMKYIYPAVKRGDENAQVVGIVAAHTDYSYIENVLKAGGGEYMDILSIHQYCENASDSPEKGGMLGEKIALVRKVMDNNGMADKELWMTEYGWSQSNVNKLRQAAYAVRTAVMNDESKIVSKLLLYNGVKKSILKNTLNYEYNYGIIESPMASLPYAASPAYAAICNYNKMINNSVCTEKSIENGYYEYTYLSPYGKKIKVLWSDGKKIQADISKIDEASVIYDMYGNVLEKQNGFLLSDCPVYIVDEPVTISKDGVFIDADELKKGDEITVALKNTGNILSENVDVYVAQYSDDILLDIKTADSDERFNASAQINYSGGSIKIFVWEKETLKPVCSSVNVIEQTAEYEGEKDA